MEEMWRGKREDGDDGVIFDEDVVVEDGVRRVVIWITSSSLNTLHLIKSTLSSIEEEGEEDDDVMCSEQGCGCGGDERGKQGDMGQQIRCKSPKNGQNVVIMWSNHHLMWLVSAGSSSPSHPLSSQNEKIRPETMV